MTSGLKNSVSVIGNNIDMTEVVIPEGNQVGMTSACSRLGVIANENNSEEGSDSSTGD